MNIDVNHESLKNLASEIREFRTTFIRDTSSVVDSVDNDIAGWAGEDKDAFTNKWDHLKDTNSNYDVLIKSLEKYADALDEASRKYKNQQRDAINRIELIP